MVARGPEKGCEHSARGLRSAALGLNVNGGKRPVLNGGNRPVLNGGNMPVLNGGNRPVIVVAQCPWVTARGPVNVGTRPVMVGAPA